MNKVNMAKYTSAYERLLGLPGIFSLNMMVRATGMNRSTAKVLLSRWAVKGMIEPAGPRTAIYFNRVVDRNGEQANAVRALMMKYPSATLCGASVLHSAGWTTQIPSELHAAVESRPSYAKIEGVVLHPRPVSWFRLMQDQGAWQSKDDEDFASFGLRSLSPSWALADLYADESGQAWQPDEDDLDIPDEQIERVREACAAMGSTPDWLISEGAGAQQARDRRQ